jgi:hypothetical protein
MQKLEVTLKDAIVAHSKADAKGKELLENLYGKETFNQKITDKIKTFDDVLDWHGIKNDTWQSVTKLLTPDEVAYKQVKLIAECLNEGTVMNSHDRTQYKYYPWFEVSTSGVGFSYSYYDHWRTVTIVGSRLCYKSKDLALYAAKQFEDVYINLLTK